jgi:hypothetical protein
MRSRARWLLGTVALGLFATALAQDRPPEDRRIHLRVNGFAYYSVDGDVRRVMGAPAFALGLSAGPEVLEHRWMVRPEFSALFLQGRRSLEGGNNRLTLMSLKAVVERKFGSPDQTSQPYVRAGLGVGYNDYRLDREDAPSVFNTYSARRLAFTASLEAGVFFDERIRAYARYHYYPRADGFDFSGLELGVAVSVFRF